MRIFGFVGIFLLAFIIEYCSGNRRYNPYPRPGQGQTGQGRPGQGQAGQGGRRSSVGAQRRQGQAGSVAGTSGTDGRYSATLQELPHTAVNVDLFKLLDSDRDGKLEQSDFTRCNGKPILGHLSREIITNLQNAAIGNGIDKAVFNQKVTDLNLRTVDIAYLNEYGYYNSQKLQNILGISESGARKILKNANLISPQSMKNFIETRNEPFNMDVD